METSAKLPSVGALVCCQCQLRNLLNSKVILQSHFMTLREEMVATYERLDGAGVEGPVDPMFPVVVALLMVARAHVTSVRAWG